MMLEPCWHRDWAIQHQERVQSGLGACLVRRRGLIAGAAGLQPADNLVKGQGTVLGYLPCTHPSGGQRSALQCAVADAEER